MRVRRSWVLAAVAGTAVLCAAIAVRAQSQPVTFDRLVKADQEPANWMMYSQTYNGWRFSRLNQINTQTVKNLQVKWLFQGRHEQKFETTPLVVDGIMYLTRPENDIFAVDAETGRVLWVYSHKNPERTYNCCGKVNRGLAILGNTLFMNTLDMHIIAIDAKSGREIWKTKMYDYAEAGGYAATGAPLVVKDKIIVGMAGGEHPISGFLDAYDVATGKHLWRFHTIPQPGEANFGSWAGDSWKYGGVSTWNNGSYDPETNTVFWGTSNPWPDYNRDGRAGDDLYSCSVLALDPDTGKLKWYFQFTPHDTHDWDATQIPILLDAPFRGENKHLMAWAARNGFFYLLDRSNGKFLLAKNFVRQTWAKGIDDQGRPEQLPGIDPTTEGQDTIYPGTDGGANWMSHSYSPMTKLLYVFAREEHRLFTKNTIRHGAGDDAGPAEGSVTAVGNAVAAANIRPPQEGNNGAAIQTEGGNGMPVNPRRPMRFAPEESWGKVTAIDPLTAQIKWEHKVLTPGWSGLLSTAGNLVFGGTFEGMVFGLNAQTGEMLWHFSGNDRVYAGPISYLVKGKQYISIPVGDVIVTFGL